MRRCVWQGRRLFVHGLTAATDTEPRLAVALAIGSVVGSALQFFVQIPSVLRLLSPLQWKATFRSEHVRTIVHNFFPVFISRGVVQLSAFVDQMLASPLPTGAVAALSYAQIINQLPVSLFGMAVSAAELPAMSAALGTPEQIAAKLRARLAAGLQQIAWFVVPSAVAFVVLGDVVVAAIYRTGHFDARDVTYVWSALAGSGVGLLAGTSGRLYSSAFYALRNTRTPLNFAVIRVALTLGLGYFFSKPAAAPAGHRSALGRGWTDALRRTGGVARILAAPPRDATAHRRRQLPGQPRPSLVVRRHRCRGALLPAAPASAGL